MNRALPKIEGKPSPVRAVSLGPTVSRSMAGRNPAIALQTIGGFRVQDAAAAKQFESMYLESKDPMIRAAGRDTFEAVAMLQSIQKRPYTPAGGAEYPRSPFGESMRQIAQLIKSDVGVEMAFADIRNWDHHVNEPAQLASRLTDFGKGLRAFWQDMGDRMGDIAVVTMSEFGRTAHENGNRGTDHGHANCMFVMGGSVKGGKVYGKWPGSRERAALRESRPRADHGFPRRARGAGLGAHGQSVARRCVPGLHSEIPRPGLEQLGRTRLGRGTA